MIRKQTVCLLLALCAAVTVEAKILLPQMFQSGMVVQRGKPIPVWGTADAGEKVIIRVNKTQVATVADANGHFRADLPPMRAGGPYTVMVGDVVLTDVLVGDVWLCSGQSNVDVTIERVYPQYPQEIDSYQNDRIRLFRVQTDKDTHGPKSDVLPTRWKKLTKENAWTFSALGYFLAKRMQQQTGVPQGVICNSLGGTPIEAWIGADSLQADFPLYVERTRLYDDAEMVAAQELANQRANNRWFQQLNAADPGISGAWVSERFDDSAWPLVSQYGDIAGQRRGDFVGSLWLRQHIHISKEQAGRPARLLLGTLFDQDYTFVNGQEVGRTYYQYPPRRYQIPEGLLHEGDNVLTVRFVNKYGIPHFIPEKPYMMIFGEGDTLRLGEQWRVSRGTLMPACPSGGTSIQNLPTVLYNAMLHPLAPYAVAGVVWYQGESNTGDNEGAPEDNGPAVYGRLLRKLMGNWRALWNDARMPFCIVQLANFMQPSEQPQQSGWARLREAQRRVAATDPRAELAVAIDLGETVDIHPLRKKEVAERVGLCMDRLVYGKRMALSPQPLRATAEGRVVTVTFDQPLQSVPEVAELEVAGSDGRFVNAPASAQGSTVTIQSPVDSPVAVRYAYKDNPLRANLRSPQDLPATPFHITVDR